MGAEAGDEVTGLLVAWNAGDPSAIDRLVPVVYAALRRLAHRQMRRERHDHVLQTTALVNEAYLSVEEAAEVLSVSANTVTRDWGVARLWLAREMNSRSAAADGSPQP